MGGSALPSFLKETTSARLLYITRCEASMSLRFDSASQSQVHFPLAFFLTMSLEDAINAALVAGLTQSSSYLASQIMDMCRV